jgi:septum formation protein
MNCCRWIHRKWLLPTNFLKHIPNAKLHAAWNKIIQERLPSLPVLCADTEVVLDGMILGKPHDEMDAFDMLKRYSGRTHQVLTSVGLLHDTYEKICINRTEVTFSKMSDESIQHYLASGNYKDKSGGYGIQSYIGQFISRIDGCFYSVMGLPLNTVRELLDDLRDFLLERK